MHGCQPSLAASLPTCAGIGLRPPHYAEVLEAWPAAGWLEVHSENFFGDGGEALRLLDAVRERYAVSLHGVGMSLGTGEPADRHLDRLRRLVDRIEPAAVSEHLCWSSIDGRYYNDLLPLPYSEEALRVVCTRIAEVQEVLRRRILVENVSSYVEFAGSTIPEWEFVAEVVRRTGCGLLLDVNNIYVSAHNHGFDPLLYLDAIPAAAVGEIHLAGYEVCQDFLVDTHGKPVHDAVWALYDEALARVGAKPTLIEWDTDIPPLTVLLAEAAKADARLKVLDALAA